MELKTIDEIKNDLAKEYGHISWSAFKNYCFKDDIQGSSDMLAMMNVVCERYTLQEVKRYLEIAIKTLDSHIEQEGFEGLSDCCKESITNIKIELT